MVDDQILAWLLEVILVKFNELISMMTQIIMIIIYDDDDVFHFELAFEMLQSALAVLERNTLHCCQEPLFHYMQIHIWLPVTRFWFPYKETNRQTIWIVMAPSRLCKFHAPSPPSAAH